MKSAKNTLADLLLAVLGIAAAVKGAQYIGASSGGIVQQMKITNIFLMAICIMAVYMIFSHILGGLRLPRLPKLKIPEIKIVRKDKGDHEAETGMLQPGDNTEDRRSESFFDAEREEKRTSDIGRVYNEIIVNPAAEVKESKPGKVPEKHAESAAYKERIGYADIVNKQDLVFNAAPHIRITNTKSTFSVYRNGGHYTLEPSEHWYNYPVTKDDIRNEMFKYLFSVQAFAQSNEYVIKECAVPAVFDKSADGDFFLMVKKGTVYLETV